MSARLYGSNALHTGFGARLNTAIAAQLLAAPACCGRGALCLALIMPASSSASATISCSRKRPVAFNLGKIGEANVNASLKQARKKCYRLVSRSTLLTTSGQR